MRDQARGVVRTNLMGMTEAAGTGRGAGNVPLRVGFGLAIGLGVVDAALRLTFRGRSQPVESLWRVFDATSELSLVTWFSVVAVAALGIVCVGRAREGRWWYGPGAFFLFLSADDACQLHEGFGRMAYEHVRELPVYAWLLVVAPVFVVVGVVLFVRLWRALPEQRRRAWLLVGFGLWGLALALEVVEGSANGSEMRLRGIPIVEYTKWLEELCEMVAPLLLLAAVMPAGPAREEAPVG